MINVVIKVLCENSWAKLFYKGLGSFTVGKLESPSVGGPLYTKGLSLVNI